MTFGGSMARSTKNGGRQVAKTSDMLGSWGKSTGPSGVPARPLWLRLRRKEKVKGTPRSPLKTTGKVTGTFTSLILWIY
jgi:hypothetical protein